MMSLAEEMLPGIGDALSDEPEAYHYARNRMASIRDRAIDQLAYELAHPDPFYDSAEGWARHVATEFGLPADEMALAEVLIQCASRRLAKGNVLQAKLDMAEAAGILEVHANGGDPRAIGSLAQIAATLRSPTSASSIIEHGAALALIEPAGAC